MVGVRTADAGRGALVGEGQPGGGVVVTEEPIDDASDTKPVTASMVMEQRVSSSSPRHVRGLGSTHPGGVACISP